MRSVIIRPQEAAPDAPRRTVSLGGGIPGMIPPAGQRITDIKPRYTARTAMWDMRGFDPYPWQRVPLTEIVLPPEKGGPRFFPINVGRGAGKTTLAPELVWEGATCQWNDNQGAPQVKIFADTFEHGNLIWDAVWQDATTVLKPLIYHMDGERNIITLCKEGDTSRPGATIQLLSAGEEKMLTGHNKLTLAVTDESQFITDKAWKQFYPCLNIRKAVWVGFGVCQGQGWYKTASLRGSDPEEWPEYRTWAFPSTDNPLFTNEDYELNKREYTPDQFAQLFLAQWTNAEGQVFENIDGCITNAGTTIFLENGKPLILEEPQPGASYTAGVDIAQARDYMTVVVLKRDTGRLVAALRANKRTYTFLESLVAELLLSYSPQTYFDTTSMGQSVYEHIRTYMQGRYNSEPITRLTKASLHPMPFNGSKRQELIDDLAIALVQERIRFANIKQLVTELRQFEKQVTPSGAVRMSAPDGLHDDMVFALALSVQGMPPVVSSVRLPVVRRTGGWERMARQWR